MKNFTDEQVSELLEIATKRIRELQNSAQAQTDAFTGTENHFKAESAKLQQRIVELESLVRCRGRSERRYITQRIAMRRLASLNRDHRRLNPQEAGYFRKWNMTCQCKYCKIIKYCDIQTQRMKDERRAPLAEAAREFAE